MAGNLELLKNACRPITDHLSSQTPQSVSLSDWGSIQTGFNFNEMIPYFYQGWSSTDDYSRVEQLFSAAVAEHCANKSTAAILGCGAGGLAYSVAKSFKRTVGVDLSLPTLIQAKNLIDGEPTTVYLEKADWLAMTLDPPSPPPNAMEFIVANALSLPFHDRDLSLVVTQYLMDLIGNPSAFIEEINRVLEDGGVWINFSCPFRLPHDPQELGTKRLGELPSLMNRAGFDWIHGQSERFALLDMSNIYAYGDRFDQEAHFFIVRKQASMDTPARKQRHTLAKHLSWELVPATVAGREIALTSSKEFAAGKVVEQFKIGIRQGHSIPLPSAYVPLLEKLLTAVDGKRNLRQILDYVNADGTVFSEDEFLRFMLCLHVDHYAIDF